MRRDDASRLGLVFLMLLMLSGCDGLFHTTWVPRLGVPYIAQEQFNYCVPASVAMWRAFDGLPSVSQDFIWDEVGGAPCDGLDAGYAVRLFTHTGSDARLDTVNPVDREDYIARQMTSIDGRIPVMPIVNPARDHVGIINGGSYQYVGSTGRYTWDTVVFHDPGVGPDLEFSSNEWIAFTCATGSSYCGQIISESATFGWESNFQAFGYSVDLYDGSDGCCIEENYQN